MRQKPQRANNRLLPNLQPSSSSMRLKFLLSSISRTSFVDCMIASSSAAAKRASLQLKPPRAGRLRALRKANRLPAVMRTCNSRRPKRIAKLKCASEVPAPSSPFDAAGGGVAVVVAVAKLPQQPSRLKRKLLIRSEKKSRLKRLNQPRDRRSRPD